jgi:hypothetical protein
LFDAWVVSADPDIDDFVRGRGKDPASTVFPSTVFNRSFFENPAAQAFIFRHEFRHLMPGNAAKRSTLDPFTINPNGDTSMLPSERDADAWARYAGRNACMCGYDR